MPDKALTLEVLGQIENAAQKVVTRFETIRYPGDFTDSAAGVEKMDAICMMLIVIGESLKNLDKITECKLLPHYPEVDWKKAKGMRDIITHHYADINADTVFFTCKKKIPQLLSTTKKMIKDLKSS
ncbi:HepT-like ribonuclease domain-containing protein [uncultured Desulfobacter sp.]|uniref:HepT-like ribonuclease domain-containing protein n=1 Tax=uncultured Desulfobacter sp. TaxID=240139 RepID=UPI0029C85CFE|nr:HepT-like ribonuclease domain-containing protein [uncultured Desulfobacter sp.]